MTSREHTRKLAHYKAYAHFAGRPLDTAGSQSVGWHADDEKLFGGLIHDCTIVFCSRTNDAPIPNNVDRR